jgi:hypothetical protein
VKFARTTHTVADTFLVCEVLKQCILAPDDSLLLVRLRVFETCCLARVPTEQTIATSRRTSAGHALQLGMDGVMDAPMKVRSDFVTFARTESMALSTACLEKLSTALLAALEGELREAGLRPEGLINETHVWSSQSACSQVNETTPGSGMVVKDETTRTQTQCHGRGRVETCEQGAHALG